MQAISNDIGPAVLNQTLQLSVFHSSLIRSGMLVKVSKSTLPNSCIFPKICLAFLIQSLTDDDNAHPKDIQTRIKEFIDLHEQSLVIIIVHQLDPNTVHFIGNIQLALHPQETNIICVLNYLEAVEVIRNLSSMIHPHIKQISRDKIDAVLCTLNKENILANALKCILSTSIDDSPTDLLHTFGSISTIAKSNQQQLINSFVNNFVNED